MVLTNARSSYQQNQVTMTSAGQLLLLVLDGVLRILPRVNAPWRRNAMKNKTKVSPEPQSLLLELVTSLDHTVLPELATNLERIYMYMYKRLVHANVNDDERALTEVAELLHEMREAWGAAEQQTRCRNNTPKRG